MLKDVLEQPNRLVKSQNQPKNKDLLRKVQDVHPRNYLERVVLLN